MCLGSVVRVGRSVSDMCAAGDKQRPLALAVRLAREVAERRGAAPPNVGVILDCYSAVDMELDLPHALLAAGPWLRHVHLNDDNGRAPGYGSTDFTPIMRALMERGYEGYASIEVFDFSLDPLEHARRGLRTVREALGEA